MNCEKAEKTKKRLSGLSDDGKKERKFAYSKYFTSELKFVEKKCSKA